MNGDHLFASPGREQLSPRSVPKHNPRTDPFYSPGRNSPEASPYTSALFSPDDMMNEPKTSDIKFESVDWEKRNQQENRTKDGKRTITPTRIATKEVEYVETINLTPPMAHQAPPTTATQVPKPTYYSPPMVKMASPPPYQSAVGGGLGIQYYEEKRDTVSLPHYDTDPQTYINTPQNRAGPAAWEPTQPPPSAYVPAYKEFQDVELSRPKSYASSQRTMTEKHYEPVGYYSDTKSKRTPAWCWILYFLLFLIIFVGVPVAIFGGVYKWNYGRYRCSRSWGTWHPDTSTCTF
jgi:hypothetical protein